MFSSSKVVTLLEVEWYKRLNCNGWNIFFRLRRTDKQTLELARRVSTRYLLSAATLDSIPRERSSRKDKAHLPI